MGGIGTVPYCAVLSSFVATMGKVARPAAGGPPLGRSRNPLKKSIRPNVVVLKVGYRLSVKLTLAATTIFIQG